MQTTAISNPATQIKAPSANAQSAASKSDSASGTSFSDMLSNEMDRNTDKPTNAPAPVANAPAPARSQNNNVQATQGNSASQHSSANEAKANNAGNAQSAQASDDAPKTGASSQSSTTAQAGSKTADDDQQDSDANANGLSPESNDLIALVANMNQPRAVGGKTDKDEDGKDKDKKAAPDISAVTDSATDAAALAAQAAVAGQAAQTGTDAKAIDTSASAAGKTDVLPAPDHKAIPAPSTPIERGIVLGATPAGSELKDTTASSSKGKNAGIGATSFDAKLGEAQTSDKKASAEPLPAGTQTTQGTQEVHAEAIVAAPNPEANAATTPATHETRTAQQDQAAMANIAAMTNAPAASLSQMQAAAAPLVDNLAPRVGTQDWNQSLGQKVVWMANGEVQNASLTLNPPDLGPLQVVLSVTNNHATANFTAAQPEVRQALEAAMPKLREMLGDAGIQLGQANVSAGTPNQQNSFGSSSQQSSRHSSGKTEDIADAAIRVGRVQPARSGNGLVDTFV